MLARLCLILSILLPKDSTLPNGIRLYELSGSNYGANSFELIAGYRTSGLVEMDGANGLKEVVSAFLRTTESVRAIETAAYGSGGSVEFFSDQDRTGLRLKMPGWARPMVESAIAELFAETPQKNPNLIDRAIEEARFRASSRNDVRSEVEKQFRIALMGQAADVDFSKVSRDAVVEFFAKYYGTNRAFVVMNGAPLQTLQSVTRRESEDPQPKTEKSLGNKISRELPRNPVDSDEGAVLLGAPTPSIYYRGWYAALMLDRLIRETIPSKPQTELLPSLEPYFYRLEVAVPSGQAFETVEAALRADLNQMQYVRAPNEKLEAARRSAIQYLESEQVQSWFVSLGRSERLTEGLDWVRSFSADDMRAAARDLTDSISVVAGWSPRVRVLRLEAELLSDIAARQQTPVRDAGPKLAPLSSVKKTPFSPHTDAAFANTGPVQLDSGVSIVASTSYAVFVAPNSPNSLTIFDREPSSDLLQTSFGTYRSSRILVMAPPEAFERLRQQWSRFRGNPSDQTVVTANGKIPGPYLPSLFVLKMLLDRRLIEAGMWSDVQLEILASDGSSLAIHGSETDRHRVLDWIGEFASQPIPEDDVEWAREAAIHHLPNILPKLQSLIWEWTPDGIVFDFHFIPSALIKDVARMYLQ